MITLAKFPRSKKAKRKQKKPNPPTREQIISLVKGIFIGALYEEADFVVTREAISIDVGYNSSVGVQFYQKRLREKFPNQIAIDGNKTTIYFVTKEKPQ